jgi:hypothetical protein
MREAKRVTWNYNALGKPTFAGPNGISRDVSQMVRSLNGENVARFTHEIGIQPTPATVLTDAIVGARFCKFRRSG